MARKRKGKRAGRSASSAVARPRPSAEKLAEKREARQRRQEAARRARRRRQLRRGAVIATLVTAALGTIGWFIYQDFRADAELKAELTAGSYAYDENSDDGRDHVRNPSYAVNPPAGGAHLASPAPVGIYEGPSVPPTGALVHSLEHGKVILWYRPDLGSEGVAELKSIAKRFPDDVIVVERDSLPTRVAATAWHRRLLGDTVEQDRLVRFITEFRDQGPENVG
jgi:hypothetical protein